MRRKVMLKPVRVQISPNFYNGLETYRKKLEKKLGVTKNITHARLTELMMKSGMSFPKINLSLLKNAKK